MFPLPRAIYTIAGLKQITEAFQLCTPLTADKVYIECLYWVYVGGMLCVYSQAVVGMPSMILDCFQVEHLKGWVRNSFTSLAMVDYPYPASFLAPLPAYPVTVACHSLLAAESKLHGLAAAAG